MNSIKKNLFTFSLVGFLAIAIIGLSSWRSPQTKKAADDTTKNKKKEGRYSKKTIITFDENGKPHEEIVESFEGDEGLRELMTGGMHFNFDFPPIPDLDIVLPEFPQEFMMPPMEGLLSEMDTLDFGQFHFDGDNFELFNEDLENRLHEQLRAIGPEFEARMEEMNEQLQELNFNLNEHWSENLSEQLSELDQLSQLDHLNQDFNFDQLNEQLAHLKEFSGDWEERMKNFEDEAQKELVKDGYLKENERIESISWSDDVIEFNGMEIKKEHLDKYRELREKYLKRPTRGRIE